MSVVARLLCLLSLALWLPHAAAQTYSSPNQGPWRTVSDGDDDRLMLLGYDAVAYFTDNAAVRGDPNIKLQHMGVTWRFATEAHRAEFQRNPEKYMPQFGGFCSNGINYAVPWGAGGGPESWRIYRGKLYVFGGQAPRDQFEMDTERNLQRAHSYWNDEVAGSNPLIKRWQRIIFRVPHYKTDAELQAEWEARRDAGTLPVMPGRPQVVPQQP
jgi:YHS domain-containing protein